MEGGSADGLNLNILIFSVSDLNQHMPNPKGCVIIHTPQSPHVGSGAGGRYVSPDLSLS